MLVDAGRPPVEIVLTGDAHAPRALQHEAGVDAVECQELRQREARWARDVLTFIVVQVGQELRVLVAHHAGAQRLGDPRKLGVVGSARPRRRGGGGRLLRRFDLDLEQLADRIGHHGRERVAVCAATGRRAREHRRFLGVHEPERQDRLIAEPAELARHQEGRTEGAADLCGAAHLVAAHGVLDLLYAEYGVQVRRPQDLVSTDALHGGEDHLVESAGVNLQSELALERHDEQGRQVG